MIVTGTGPVGPLYFGYDLSGHLISEKYSVSIWEQDYVYLNGRLIAKLVDGGDGGGGTLMGTMDIGPPPPPPSRPDIDVYYYHLDHLGTPQKMTDSNKVIRWSGDYYPFGELYAEPHLKRTATASPVSTMMKKTTCITIGTDL